MIKSNCIQMFWVNIKKFEEKVYPNENFMPDNQENFQTPTKQKLFPKNVLKKKIGKPVLLYTGTDNPIKKQLKKLL
jgi:hypothetical protein